jgi:hypothetical protein
MNVTAPVRMSPRTNEKEVPALPLATLGEKQKTVARENKKPDARKSRERKAWRRFVIDLSLVRRQQAESIILIGRSFSRNVARRGARPP